MKNPVIEIKVPSFIDLNLPLSLIDTHINDEIKVRNCHDDIEIIFATEGSGHVNYDLDFIPIKKHEFCVINANCIHGAKSNDNLHFTNVIISNEFFDANQINIKELYFEKIFKDEVLEDKLNIVREIFNKRERLEYSYAEISVALLDFVLHLIKNHSSKRQQPSTGNDIHFAVNYIKANLDKKITLDEIAAQAGLSKYHFSRQFKKLTGMTVIEFVNLYRCKKACSLLSANMYTVRQVFELSCFENFSYFTKTFKKNIGMLPSEYLKSEQKKLKKNQSQSTH